MTTSFVLSRLFWRLLLLLVALMTAVLIAPQSSSANPPRSKDLYVVVMISGGGSRAAAFGRGVLAGLNMISIDEAISLADEIDAVGGVSGGSILAAFFALYGPNKLNEFDERFLGSDLERHIGIDRSSLGMLNSVINGGVDPRRLKKWLSNELFGSYKFGDLSARKRPSLWLSATDLVRRTPFGFDPTTLSALCVDRAQVKIADAVTASSAAPVAFAPMSFSTSPGECRNAPPSHLEHAARTQGGTMDQWYKELLAFRREDSLTLHLIDGALSDNLGLLPIVHSLSLVSDHGPFADDDGLSNALEARNLLFVIVDAQSLEGLDEQNAEPSTRGISLYTTTHAPWRTTSNALSIDLLRDRLKDLKARAAKQLAQPGQTATLNWQLSTIRLLDLPETGENKRLRQLPTTLTLSQSSVRALKEAGRRMVFSDQHIRQFLLNL